MIQTYLNRYERTVGASKNLIIPGDGDFVFVESASRFFSLQPEDRSTLQTKGRFKMRLEPFRRLTVTNLSDTEALKLVLWVGKGDISYDEIVLPQTVLIGAEIDLDPTDTQDFRGVDTTGRRRKQFTLTLRPGLDGHGNIAVYEIDEIGQAANGTLLAIIGAASSGGGFAIETDQNLRIVNNMDVNVNSTDPDIAVAETRYLAN